MFKVDDLEESGKEVRVRRLLDDKKSIRPKGKMALMLMISFRNGIAFQGREHIWLKLYRAHVEYSNSNLHPFQSVMYLNIKVTANCYLGINRVF